MTFHRARAVAAALGALLCVPLAAIADTPLAERFAAGRVDCVRVELASGRVQVVGHDGPEVRIDGAAHGLGASSVHFSTFWRGGELVVRADAEPWIDWMRAAPNIRVRVAVPRRRAVRVVEPGAAGGVRVWAREGAVEIDAGAGRVRALAGGPPVRPRRDVTPPEALFRPRGMARGAASLPATDALLGL